MRQRAIVQEVLPKLGLFSTGLKEIITRDSVALSVYPVLRSIAE
jgi:hypothetical protein